MNRNRCAIYSAQTDTGKVDGDGVGEQSGNFEIFPKNLRK